MQAEVKLKSNYILSCLHNYKSSTPTPHQLETSSQELMTRFQFILTADSA